MSILKYRQPTPGMVVWGFDDAGLYPISSSQPKSWSTFFFRVFFENDYHNFTPVSV